MGEIRYPLSINQATTKVQWTLREAVEGYAKQDVHGIAVWRDKLEECGLREAARILSDNGMTVTGLCRGGMFPATDKAGLKAAIDDNLRAVDEAVAIGAQCLVLVCGGLPEGSKDIAGARAMIRDGIAATLPHARAAGMPLAIEPLHPMYAADRACINSLEQSNDICDELGAGVGLAVDVYHVWWDPYLRREIDRAAKADPGRLLAFHICDWLSPTKDMLTDRGMMGDGVIDIPDFRAMMENAGYDGYVEVEIFSTRWWNTDPDEVVATCIERHRSAC
ncbi:MAG: sugar phosphate isomerase/epimerase [Rhodospirillales bacterium]|jgi:sugar phosphate isomerase/epimerase|nr:sugar phosphate isomerase/epimerase [Rhodospirillales bacterium]